MSSTAWGGACGGVARSPFSPPQLGRKRKLDTMAQESSSEHGEFRSQWTKRARTGDPAASVGTSNALQMGCSERSTRSVALKRKLDEACATDQDRTQRDMPRSEGAARTKWRRTLDADAGADQPLAYVHGNASWRPAQGWRNAPGQESVMEREPRVSEVSESGERLAMHDERLAMHEERPSTRGAIVPSSASASASSWNVSRMLARSLEHRKGWDELGPRQAAASWADWSLHRTAHEMAAGEPDRTRTLAVYYPQPELARRMHAAGVQAEAATGNRFGTRGCARDPFPMAGRVISIDEVDDEEGQCMMATDDPAECGVGTTTMDVTDYEEM